MLSAAGVIGAVHAVPVHSGVAAIAESAAKAAKANGRQGILPGFVELLMKNCSFALIIAKKVCACQAKGVRNLARISLSFLQRSATVVA